MQNGIPDGHRNLLAAEVVAAVRRHATLSIAGADPASTHGPTP
jgi:hypothetical protein